MTFLSFISLFNRAVLCLQLFYSFFKSLVGKDVIIELKNDLRSVLTINYCSGHVVYHRLLKMVQQYRGWTVGPLN